MRKYLVLFCFLFAFPAQAEPCDVGTKIEECKEVITSQTLAKQEQELITLKAIVIMGKKELVKREQDWQEYFKAYTNGH